MLTWQWIRQLKHVPAVIWSETFDGLLGIASPSFNCMEQGHCMQGLGLEPQQAPGNGSLQKSCTSWSLAENRPDGLLSGELELLCCNWVEATWVLAHLHTSSKAASVNVMDQSGFHAFNVLDIDDDA